MVMCYYYQLFIEGVFDESIRLLFLLAATIKGRSISSRPMNRMDLWKLRKGIQELGLDEVFFQGWENRVRNSIAHCRFRYDDKLEKMHFVDHDPKGKLPDYSRWFTWEEFGELLRQALDVYTVIQDVILMIRIQQLVLAPEVPRVGEDLIMPEIRKWVKEGLLQDPNS